MNVRLLAYSTSEILKIQSAFPRRRPFLKLKGEGRQGLPTAPVLNEVRYGNIGNTEERSANLCTSTGQTIKGITIKDCEVLHPVLVCLEPAESF